MTQKQTDYDMVLQATIDLYNHVGNTQKPIIENIIEFAFRKGYEYGRKQSIADHERNLIALGDEYMTARENAFNESYSKFCESTKGLNVGLKCTSAYQQGWNDADAFDDEWIEQHPKDLLDRLLDSHPDIIENEVKARMKDLENEKLDHFRDSTKKVRYEIAKAAMQQLMPLDVEAYHQPDKVAELAVTYADYLIKELGKEEE